MESTPVQDRPRDQFLEDTILEYKQEQKIEGKFTNDDVLKEEMLGEIALEYLGLYKGNFDYLKDLKRNSRGNLTVSQVRGVINTMVAEANRRLHPLGEPITGLVFNGFYAGEGIPILSVGEMQDGNKVLSYLDSESDEWVGFATATKHHTWFVWNRHKENPELVAAATAFFQADLKQRNDWSEFYTFLTGLCCICGINKPYTDHSACPSCEAKILGEELDHATTGISGALGGP